MEGLPAIVAEKFNALPSIVQTAVLEGLKLKGLDERAISALTIANLRNLAEKMKKDSRKFDARFAGYEAEVEDLLHTLTEHRRLMDLEKMPEKEGILKRIGKTIWRHKISFGLSLLALVGGLHYFKYIDLKKIPQVGEYLAKGVETVGGWIAAGLTALSAKAREFWAWFERNILARFRAPSPGGPELIDPKTGKPVVAPKPGPDGKPSEPPSSPSPSDKAPAASSKSAPPPKELPHDPGYSDITPSEAKHPVNPPQGSSLPPSPLRRARLDTSDPHNPRFVPQETDVEPGGKLPPTPPPSNPDIVPQPPGKIPDAVGPKPSSEGPPAGKKPAPPAEVTPPPKLEDKWEDPTK
jgi:hypothetical protein